MKLNNFLLKAVFYFLLTTYCFTSYISLASDLDDSIVLLISKAPSTSLTERISFFSQALLHTPYQIEPLGEGQQGKFNQNPLYRLDRFDCETFVDTVLALVLAENQEQFQTWMNIIRYANGAPSFLSRNHFTDADWLVNNQRKGLVKNISAEIVGLDKVAIAQALIDKKAWYQYLPADRIQIPGISLAEQQKKLNMLHALNKKAINSIAKLDYIPLTQLFIDGRAERPNYQLFSQIPSGSIILIVRPNWPIKHLIGTNINISHMGFVVQQNGQTYIRAASSVYHTVVDEELIHYLQGYMYKNSTVKGIAILAVSKPNHAIR